ncbi:hypothetical protein D9757_009102 [Collybiopsis confluens]|uniref:Uncharacterized protein n=1 Tax=Collybiopsis confluens TaxID=2823264 RepID=A0A8H5H935_9AGAR|nr:hypothetical protein D9757_009102 [Collybiopsis confluens]
MATFAIPLHSAASSSPPTQWSRLPAYSSPASAPSNFPVGNSSVPYAVSAQEATFRPRKRRRTAQAEFRNMRSATEDHQDEETSGGELVQLEIYSTQAPGRASKPRHYDSGPSMMEALGSFFKITGNNCFLGTYHAQNTPEIPDKHRIQLVIHEIWRVTGYRFTVKDHPPAKNGHTTRLWCSQDSQRKANTRYTSNGAKQRFPCRSRLLVSSRDGKTSGYRSITVRMYHHVQHEPYSDSAIPIAASTSSAMSTFLQPNLNTPTVDNGPQSGVYYSEGLSPPRLPPLGESDDEECLSEGGGNDDEDGRGETHFATDSVSPHHPDQASSTFHQRAQFVPSYPPPMTIPLTQHPLYAAPVIYSVLSHSPLNTLGREHVVPGPGYQSHSHPHPDSHPPYAAPLLTARPPVTPSPYSSSHSHRLLPQPPIPPQAQGVEPPPMSAPNGNGRGSSTQSESSPSNRSHGLPSNSSSSPSSSPPCP